MVASLKTTKRFPLLNYTTHLKNPVCKENQTFLAKPDVTTTEPERKKRNIARDLQKLDSCGHRCRSQRIHGVRYEVLHLGFLSPR
ncbi:hypothetical protein CEXT_46541 [Caerostris extrusa]|uniref:Uncharacterized protein n=1 Tax=Caerostris extrusa TaxID=172846 RepID=A0AAV4MPK9_CAEEX|nr:hypothetical protein CEXT_46541 [Caerostris extrusa]